MKVCELFVGLDHAQRHWQFPCLAAASPLGDAGQLTTEMLMLCKSNPVAFQVKSHQKYPKVKSEGHAWPFGSSGWHERSDRHRQLFHGSTGGAV